MIKLKSGIHVAEENKKLLVYDQKSRRILSEIQLNTEHDPFHLEEFQLLAYHFHTIPSIFQSRYGRLLLSLYKNKPSYFEEGSDETAAKEKRQTDIEQTVNRDLFFLTYEYDAAESIGKKTIYIWGYTRIVQLLLPNLSGLFRNVIVLLSSTDERPEKREEGVAFCEAESWAEAEEVETSAVHLISRNAFGHDQFWKITKQLQARESTVLHYGMTVKELQVGPLVIGGQTAQYGDFDQQYKPTSGILSETLAYVGAGLVNRTLYFLLLDSLAYLGEDAQLPLNTVFTVDKYTLEGTACKIWKEVDVHESRSTKLIENV